MAVYGIIAYVLVWNLRCAAAQFEVIFWTAILIGVKDRILGIGEYQVATLPGAKASFYEGVGYSPFWEDTPRFNREFIALRGRDEVERGPRAEPGGDP